MGFRRRMPTAHRTHRGKTLEVKVDESVAFEVVFIATVGVLGAHVWHGSVVFLLGFVLGAPST